jgi:hypothetical protein
VPIGRDASPFPSISTISSMSQPQKAEYEIAVPSKDPEKKKDEEKGDTEEGKDVTAAAKADRDGKKKEGEEEELVSATP